MQRFVAVFLAAVKHLVL